MGLESPYKPSNRGSFLSSPMPTNNPTFEAPACSPPSHHASVDDCGSSDSSDTTNEFPQAEQLLVSHLRFAHALRKNDAAMILQYLAKDVILVSIDGSIHEGQSAVLASLVGARMTKLSANLHIKGCPTRSGCCQSTFIYEHGIVFKDPLFMEVLDWKLSSATITRITHFALPNAKSGKTPNDFSKSAPLRLSFGARWSDEEDPSGCINDSDSSEMWDAETSNQAAFQPVQTRSRRLKSTSSADYSSSAVMNISSASLKRTGSSSSNQSGGYEASIQPLTPRTSVVPSARSSAPLFTLAEISCRGLKPIRKRKTVNPFVILRCPVTGSVWKSPINRRDPNPKWNHITFKIPSHNLADVVEISLWDHTFFRSIKVAGAALVVSDLLNQNSDLCTTIELERCDAARIGGDAPHVSLHVRFVQHNGGDGASRSVNEAEPMVAKGVTEISKTLVGKEPHSNGSYWLKTSSLKDGHHASMVLMLVRAAIVAFLVWMLYRASLLWPLLA
ncbi:hypothetical protein CCR75_000532 [Bremia lactucae]|uniref:C2 domain-containing protein n=1 Tax=Bremia lactucae TaxID=4779 RepID=A0A976IJ56_BRELC|nr:hypothetical protein CCR75_000532 [Bremia lactucae]